MANLEKVDHIVVLMLENRSFDHMLGYLSLEGARSDVDGLRPEFANEHEGRSYPVHHLGSTAIPDDPDHSASSVDLQIGGGTMNGFVTSFADTLSRRGVQDGDPARVMGYYNAADVPVYDHLAREFAGSPSTTRWPPARSGRKRCWSSSMTSTAASSITSRRPARPTTTRRCSAATGCGCRRWPSRRWSSHARYHIRSSTTRRSSRRSCCASAPTHSTSPSGITGCSRGSAAPGAPIPWGRGWRTPMIWENCSPAARRGPLRPGTR